MLDVTWRTGCTFTILLLLVLLGSGALLQGSYPAPGPSGGGDGTWSAGHGAGLSTPEPGDGLPAGTAEASTLSASVDQGPATGVRIPVARAAHPSLRNRTMRR